MCGVIGLIYERENPTLGEVAVKLLKMLEYRGYDSTGACIQTQKGKTTLLKDVGAPSDITYKLGIDKLSGQVFCGQVRWATFGVVTKANAQPHEVRCKTHLYGAHNGNITNCMRLKEWLQAEGHEVKSDNDGEMLVHTVEHFFALELQYKDADDPKVREKAMKTAILLAAQKCTGSFAAIIVDPVTKLVSAIKAGSSLYIGRGTDPESGDFILASSDLASVLQLTKILLPIKEGEFAMFTPADLQLFEVKTGKKLKREFQRCLLKVEETRLQAPHRYFMEQEIAHQIPATRRLATLFTGGNSIVKWLRAQKSHAPLIKSIREYITSLAEMTDSKKLQSSFQKFLSSREAKELLYICATFDTEGLDLTLESSHASFLEDLRELITAKTLPIPVFLKFIDAMFDLDYIHDVDARVASFVSIVTNAAKRGNTVYMLACGSSFHAAKTAPIFFNELAQLPIIPLLPGEFRAQSTQSIRDGDVVIGISQSGETKDLIDVFNFMIRSGKDVKRICILNNTNSTLALEKSDLFIPLFCGPEIAVPATKSFMNQLVLLYILAIRVGEQLHSGKTNAKKPTALIAQHLENLARIPELIDKTLKNTQKETDEIAADLYLKPSMHILATRILGIAKEGALKIREIVLNHTEGFEGSEFKHGPNTILGVNTVFGLDSVSNLLVTFCDALHSTLNSKAGKTLDGMGVQRLFRSVAEFAFQNLPPKYLGETEQALFKSIFAEHNFFASLYSNYPLIFVTCPEETDINLTISQINTHKIRGADVYMIAEDNDLLREAVSLPPGSSTTYRHGYITLPRTDNPLLAIFPITVVLQQLSLKMSQKKMEFLDRLEIDTHGVHPDVPKNVSKSITVD